MVFDAETGRGGGFCLGLPDVVQIAFGLGLDGFRHRIQHVRGFMDPTALRLRRGEPFAPALGACDTGMVQPDF